MDSRLAFSFANSELLSASPTTSTKPSRRSASTCAGPMKPVPIMPTLIVRMNGSFQLKCEVRRSNCEVRGAKYEWRGTKCECRGVKFGCQSTLSFNHVLYLRHYGSSKSTKPKEALRSNFAFRYSNFLHEGKVLQHPQTHVLAFLWVKLSRPDVAASRDRREVDAVVSGGKYVPSVFAFCIIGMHKVHEAIFANAVEQRIRTLQVKLIPTDVGNQQSIRQALDFSRYEVETIGVPKLFTLAE